MDSISPSYESLPSDPLMLLSLVNTKLRDEYDSLEEFCSSTGTDCALLTEKLRQAGFEYNRENNKFW